MGFFDPIGNWFKGAGQSISQATTNKKIGDVFIKVGKAMGGTGGGIIPIPKFLQNGLVDLGAIKIMSTPQGQVEWIEWKEKTHPTGHDVLHMLNKIGKNELSNYMILFYDTMNVLVYVCFPEFDGEIRVLEELGTEPIMMLEDKITGKLIPIGRTEQYGCTIVESSWLELHADGTMEVRETLKVKGSPFEFTTKVKFTTVTIPAGAQM